MRNLNVLNQKELLTCYEASLAQSPGVQGKVVVDFEVDDLGNVSKVVGLNEKKMIYFMRLLSKKSSYCSSDIEQSVSIRGTLQVELPTRPAKVSLRHFVLTEVHSVKIYLFV